MRTTVEISATQHRALTALAQRRGVRGFSLIVQEALDAYLASVEPDEVEHLLGLEGVLDDAEVERTRAQIAEVRDVWRAS